MWLDKTRDVSRGLATSERSASPHRPSRAKRAATFACAWERCVYCASQRRANVAASGSSSPAANAASFRIRAVKASVERRRPLESAFLNAASDCDQLPSCAMLESADKSHAEEWCDASAGWASCSARSKRRAPLHALTAVERAPSPPPASHAHKPDSDAASSERDATAARCTSSLDAGNDPSTAAAACHPL